MSALALSGHKATHDQDVPSLAALGGKQESALAAVVALICNSSGDNGRKGNSRANQRPKLPSTSERVRRTSAVLGPRRGDDVHSQHSIV